MLVINRYQRRLLSRLRMNYPARECVPLTRAVDSLAMAGLVEYEASDFRSTKKNVNQYVYVWLSPIPNRIHYSVCEMCANRNEELLNTVDQLERELALLTESSVPNIGLTAIEAQNEDLQHRLGQLERENIALQSKLERKRQAHKRRDRDLSLMSASYRHKLEHLVSKFRKLKASGANTASLEESSSLHDTLNAKENNMAKLDITVNELGAGDMCARGVSVIIDGISAEDAARVSLRFLSAIDPMEADDPETPQHVCTCHASDEDKRPPENKVHVIRHTGKRNNYFAPMDVE